MLKLIKGLLEGKSTRQSPNVAPLTSMTNKNKSGFGFIKGLIRFRHTIASAFVIIPTHGESTQSLIDPYGVATTGMMLMSGMASSSLITSAADNSLIDINGTVSMSEINPNGIASESSV